MRSSMRARISAAARSVNVITRIELGEAPANTSRRKRSAMTAVFPVPAPATTRTGPRPMADAPPQLQAVEAPYDHLGVEPQLVRERRAGRGHDQDARAKLDLVAQPGRLRADHAPKRRRHLPPQQAASVWLPPEYAREDIAQLIHRAGPAQLRRSKRSRRR